MVHRQVAVVVDSSCCLPPGLLQQWGIITVPYSIVINGQSLRDGIDIHPQEFYRWLKGNHGVPTTATPGPQQFSQAFLEAGQVASEILCLTLSSQFSSSYQFACAAVPIAKRALPQARIEVMDTQSAAGAYGLIALAAARLIAAGHFLDSVGRHVKGLAPRVDLIAFLNTLHYLGRSGRVPKIQAWAGSLLGIKPITELKLGEARMIARSRSSAKATDRLVAIMHDRVGDRPVHVNVMEADATPEAEALLRRIESEFRCHEKFISQFTPVMGAHTGPGLLGLAFYTDDGECSLA